MKQVINVKHPSIALEDIENELVMLDKLFMKYIPDIHLIKDCVYAKGFRFPLESLAKIEMYNNQGNVSNTPFHPFLSIEMVIAILQSEICQSNKDDEHLFIKNPLIPLGGISYIDSYIEDIDIVLNYLPCIKGHTIDINSILNIVDRIKTKVIKHTCRFPGYLFQFDTTRDRVIIHNHGDIRAVRFSEYCDYLEVQRMSNLNI